MVPPVAVIAAAGTFLWRTEGGASRALEASTNAWSDQDGDGLSDREEGILQTSPIMADTDGDGFSDLEEFARGTSRLLPTAALADDALAIGVSVCDRAGQFEVVLALYLPDANLRNKEFSMGLVAGRRVVELNRDQVLAGASIALHPAATSEALLAIVRVPFNPQVVHAVGGLSLYATVGHAGTGLVSASGSIRLIGIDGVAMLCLPDPFAVPPPPPPNGVSIAPQTGASTGANGGTIFVPLTFDNDPPTLWSPGQICYQKSSPVGTNGLLITHEVVRADCMDNWDAFCPPTCSASVGSTFEDVDPLALLGG